MTRRRPAVFLDRDGVLVGSDVRDGVPVPAVDPQVLPGVEEACAALRAAGFWLVMVTNQPDIARGLVPAAEVERVNEDLRARLGLDDVRVCPHDDGDGCRCRKPAPGMLVEAARHAGVDLSRSFMVGDRWRDIDAGRAAGTSTVWIDLGHAERRPEAPDLTVASLGDAVPFILGAGRRTNGGDA